MKAMQILLLAFVTALPACHDGMTDPPALRAVVFSPDGQWLVAGGGSDAPGVVRTGIVKVWETKAWQSHASWREGFSSPVKAVFFIEPDSVAAVSAQWRSRSFFDSSNPWAGTSIRSWRISKREELEPVLLPGYQVQGNHVGYFAPHKLIAMDSIKPATRDSPGVYTWPALEKKALFDYNPRSLLRFSPDGKRVFAVKHQRSERDSILRIRLYDVTNEKTLTELELHKSNDEERDSLSSAAVSSDGETVAVAVNRFVGTTYAPGRIHVVKADLSKTLWVLDAPEVSNCIQFSPDGEWLAIKQDHNSVQLYSIKSKEPATKFEGNAEGVNGWCFSSDGNWIAIASGGYPQGAKFSPGRVRVFEVKSGRLVAELD